MNRSLRALLCALAMSSLPAAEGLAAPATRTKATATKKAVRPAAPAKPGPAAMPADPAQEQAQQTAERDRLNARIAELKQQIAAGERSRSGAAAALARAERALVDVTRRLDELAARQRTARELLASLDRQRTGTEGEIATQQTDIDRATRQLYAQGERDPLKTWLSGGDPTGARLTRAYLGYAIRADADALASLRSKAVVLQAQRQRADHEDRRLLQQAEAQKSAREALAADQAAQRQTLADLSKKIAEQRNTAVAMENDEKRLGRVIEQLQRAQAQRAQREREQQAAAERARREAARVAALAAEQQATRSRRNRTGIPGTTEPPPKVVPEPPPVTVDAVPDDAVGSGAFAQLRGRLRLPVRGAITGRYGSPRGGGGATWKGVFVRTENGAEVRAVAAGRVIFSDELRGFGNLLIVDHGGQYLSIYANNETLLRHTGDAVKPGDVVSRAGNSSGDDQTGLYFELRFQGRPFDPMTWIGGR